MNKPITLTVNRLGTFSVTAEQACDSQCGTVGHRDYRYEVAIKATNKKLIEPQMFVIDNIVVTEYFQKTYVEGKKIVKSCEVVAQDCIEHITSLFIGKKAPYNYVELQEVRVLVSGGEKSFIVGEWKR